MEVAASGIAVVSLAIQLAQSIRRINQFWTSVTYAPDEVSRIRDDLDLLESILESIAESHQNSPVRTLSTHSAAARGLSLCNQRVQKLADIVDGLQAGFMAGRRQRAWEMFKAALRKDAIAETLNHIESAKTALLVINQCLFQ